MSTLVNMLILSVAVFLTAKVIPGIQIKNYVTTVIVAVVYSVINFLFGWLLIMKILICGKGGCGKSTVAAILADAMQKRGKNVFLVDEDESNIGLYRMLGLEVPDPLMDILGEKKGFRDKTKTAGSSLGGLPRLFPEKMKIDDLPLNLCILPTQPYPFASRPV